MRISLGGGQAPAPMAGTRETSSFVPPATGGALLMEDGSYLLLEDGSKILLEASPDASLLLEDGTSYMLLEDGTKILLQ